MKINYWDCDYAEADEENIGTEDDPDYEWEYYCLHPQSDGICLLNNKHGSEKADCKLLDL